MEHILRNVLHALPEQSDATLAVAFKNFADFPTPSARGAAREEVFMMPSFSDPFEAGSPCNARSMRIMRATGWAGPLPQGAAIRRLIFPERR
jgi:hypothetical protein